PGAEIEKKTRGGGPSSAPVRRRQQRDAVTGRRERVAQNSDAHGGAAPAADVPGCARNEEQMDHGLAEGLLFGRMESMAAAPDTVERVRSYYRTILPFYE